MFGFDDQLLWPAAAAAAGVIGSVATVYLLRFAVWLFRPRPLSAEAQVIIDYLRTAEARGQKIESLAESIQAGNLIVYHSDSPSLSSVKVNGRTIGDLLTMRDIRAIRKAAKAIGDRLALDASRKLVAGLAAPDRACCEVMPPDRIGQKQARS